MAPTKHEHEFNLLSRFSELFLSPEEFAEPQISKANEVKLITKELYDIAYSSKSLNDFRTNSLPKLLIDGFDDEQIWQQIDLLNKSAVTEFSNCISNLKTNGSSIAPNALKTQTYTNELDESSTDGENERYAFDDDSDSSIDVSKPADYAYEDDDGSESSIEYSETDQRESLASENDSEPDIDDKSQTKSKKTVKFSESDIDKSRKKTKKTVKSLAYKSEVDDRFFKLSDLEEYLRLEDLKEEKGFQEKSDVEDIDLFQDIPSDDIVDSGDEEDYDITNPKALTPKGMYADFFDPPQSDDGNISEEQDEENGCTKERVNDLKGDSDDELLDSENDFEALNDQKETLEEEENETVQKTAFEQEQEKIKKKIQECEENMLQPLPWHLTGEVAAKNRPIDSLVEKDTEFDFNAKKDLVIDNVMTEKVENIIKMAIANKAFCDVERKVKRTEDIIAYKKEIVIEQIKSKKGLAEVYEEDYLNKQTVKEVAENPKHKEIKKLMDELFPELQALFSHIPKPAVPDIKIVTNLPAVTVEEVAPTNVSDAVLLAPEEVKRKSGLVKGKTERTVTDRKRERRKKKLFQKYKYKKEEEAAESMQSKSKSSKSRKREQIQILKKLKQHKNTKIANIDYGGKIKSSRDFFSKLQDTVHSQQVKSSKKKKKF